MAARLPSTCLKDLRAFEGRATVCNGVTRSTLRWRGYLWQVSLADRRTTMGLRMEARDDGPTGKGRGLINNVGNWTPFDLR